MSRLGTEEEDRGDSQSKIFIDKIGRVIIETRYCQNKVRSRAPHDVVQPRPRTFTSVFGTDMGRYSRGHEHDCRRNDRGSNDGLE